MTRPDPNPSLIVSGEQGWDAFLRDILNSIVNYPFPVAEYANFGSLPTASSYAQCIAVTTSDSKIYISDGVNWNELTSALTTERYGSIYISGGSAGQTTAAAGTYEKMTQLKSAGLSNGITADGVNSKLTLDSTGIYEVSFQCSFTGTTNSTVSLVVYWNGVQQDQIKMTRKLGTGSDIVSGGASGFLDATVAGQDLELWVSTDGEAESFLLVDGQLNARFIGAT